MVYGQAWTVVHSFAISIAQQREQVAAVAKLFGNKPVQ